MCAAQIHNLVKVIKNKYLWIQQMLQVYWIQKVLQVHWIQKVLQVHLLTRGTKLSYFLARCLQQVLAI